MRTIEHRECFGCASALGVTHSLLCEFGAPGEEVRLNQIRLAEYVPAGQAADLNAENVRLREALIPFAFIGRASMEPLGLGLEHDHARALLGLGRHEDVYANPINGGWAGYQPTCRDCGWTGETVPVKDDARGAAIAHRESAGASDEEKAT